MAEKQNVELVRGSGLAQAIHDTISNGKTAFVQQTINEVAGFDPMDELYATDQVKVGDTTYPDDHTSQFEAKLRDRKFRISVEAL